MSERLRQAIYTSNLLRETREYLAQPGNWTHGLYRTEEGDTEGSRHGDTVSAPQVCAIGGVCKTAKVAARNTEDALKYPQIQEALERLSSCSSFVNDIDDGMFMLRPIYTLNDQSEDCSNVLAMFDLAIEEQCKIVRYEAAKVADADQ